MDFNTKIKNAEFWFAQAFQLYDASKALFNSMVSRESSENLRVGAHKGSAFLLGISIENALKGVLAHRGQLVIENDRLKPNKSFPNCTAHDLFALMTLLNINVNNDEAELLKRLSIYTIWAGKYGTPLSKNDFEKSDSLLFQKTSDFTLASNLLLKLAELAGYKSESGWPNLCS